MTTAHPVKSMATDDVLVSALFRLLRANVSQDTLTSLFESIWAERKREFAEKLQDCRSPQERLEVLVGLFNEQGLTARMGRNADGELLLWQGRCPLEVTTQHTRLPCELEKDLMSNLVGLPVERTCTMAEGDPVCLYRFTADS